jgi:transcriptional repressor NrdR
MGHLQDLDLIAYIRLACVYRRFKDIDERKNALKIVVGKEELDLMNLKRKVIMPLSKKN